MADQTLLRELRECLKGYNPARNTFDSSKEKLALFDLVRFSSKWPETINAKIFSQYLARIPDRESVCREAFTKEDRSEPFSHDQVTIFIRTYNGDYCWLPSLFESIDRFAPALKLVVCVDENDEHTVKSHIPSRARVIVEDSFAKGSIQQKYSKLTADYHCETDYIIYLDSDCVLVSPFEPEDWFYNGRPCLEYTSYEVIQQYLNDTGVRGPGPGEVWGPGVSRAVGKLVSLEYSRRIEKIYKASWLSHMRSHIENLHNVPFKQFIASQHGKIERGLPKDTVYFSDFNYMGAYLWFFLRSELNWLDTSISGFWCRPLCAGQFHSHSMTEIKNGLKAVNDIPKLFLKNVFSIWDNCESKLEAQSAIEKLYLDTQRTGGN